MAFTAIDVETPGRTGVLTSEATAADVANGNKFDNDGKTRLFIQKGAGGTGTTLTFSMTPTSFGDTVTAETVTVLVNEWSVAGPFPVNRLNASGDDAGQVTVTHGGNDTTNITLMPFH